MKAFQRILAVLLCLVMSLGMISMVASAATSINMDGEGTLTIHKYASDKKNGFGDGTTNVALPAGAEPLKDVTFTVYMVKNKYDTFAYYDGVDNSKNESTDTEYNSAVSISTYAPDKVFDTSKALEFTATVEGDTKSAAAGAGIEITTNDSGVAAITLPVGMYVVVETNAPPQVSAKADPFLVSIPMINATNDGWMYDVDVYPKNSTSQNTVSLLKVDNNDASIPGVSFTLTKLNAATGTWADITENTDAEGKIDFGTLTHGTYRLTENSAPDGYIVDQRYIEFKIEDVTNDKGEITEKAKVTIIEGRDRATVLPKKNDNGEVNGYEITVTNEKPTVSKDFVNPDVKDTLGVGDEVDFTVEVYVPENIALLGDYVITDTPSGMTVLGDTIIVKCGDEKLGNTHYQLTQGAPLDGYIIKLKNEAMADYAGETLTITYTAFINEDAASSNVANNNVKLTYNSVINANGTPADPKDKEDKEETKTYKAIITKKLGDGTTYTSSMGPITFKLYDAFSSTKAIKVVQTGSGIYMVYDGESGTYTETLEVGNDSTLTINGLKKGTYYLEETKTVDGYNLLSDRVVMKVGEETDFVYDITIVNKKGFNLPQTGGIGTLMFIIIGGVLMAGGICLIVPNKKRAI